MTKVAVIGAGISGITASYLLSKKYEVTLFEKDQRIGGHTNTIKVDERGKELQVDTGFIVLNDCNYGMLHNIFSAWNVPVRWSDMSFSYYDVASNYYYAGTTIFGLFPTTKHLYSSAHYSLLKEIVRFGLIGERYLKTNYSFDGQRTLGEFLNSHNFSKQFLDKFLLPMGSAIWSVPMGQILEFPLISFLSFFKNHGLLAMSSRPRWQTVVGGSSAYVRKFKEAFKGLVKTSVDIKKVKRGSNQVEIEFKNGDSEVFDKIVFALHADQVLSLIDEPTEEEIKIFSNWRYEKNTAILHTDSDLMPPKQVSWASWNYHSNSKNRAVLTYYMNKLQGIVSEKDYFVSLNCLEEINSEKVIQVIEYDHPVYDLKAIESQRKLHTIQNTKNTYYCGSYFGNGFHEDGCRSGAQVALINGITP